MQMMNSSSSTKATEGMTANHSDALTLNYDTSVYSGGIRMGSKFLHAPMYECQDYDN